MTEGWLQENYFILFTGEESAASTKGYDIQKYLPGATIVGLKGWDDFIIQMPDGKRYTVPTVPLLRQYMSELNGDGYRTERLSPDPEKAGKIKWYVTPIVFGGDAGSGKNMIWVDLVTHQQLVKWWNEEYLRIASLKQRTTPP